MSFETVLELIPKFPRNKDIPRLVRLELDKAKGLEKVNIERSVEALHVAANTDKDFELLAKNFARIRNQLKITNDLLDQYKEYYEPEKKDKKEKE